MKDKFWETVNKIIYSPTIKETIATMAKKIIAEFDEVYHYFARLRQMDASPGKNIADPVSWQSKIDSDNGDWWIRNKDNTGWIKFATINQNGGTNVEHAKEAEVANKTKGTLTIQRNSAKITDFNGSADKTANIIVPTKLSELINDSGFVTMADVSNVLGRNNIIMGGFNVGYADTFTAPLPSGYTESQCQFLLYSAWRETCTTQRTIRRDLSGIADSNPGEFKGFYIVIGNR